jgi:hypothetical protein
LTFVHPPTSTDPSSIIVGNGSALPVTSVGDSALPDPFYLNNVLVIPDIIQNLLSVFTIDNWCSMEFDPFSFSIKDLSMYMMCLPSHPAPSLHASVPSPFASTST